MSQPGAVTVRCIGIREAVRSPDLRVDLLGMIVMSRQAPSEATPCSVIHDRNSKRVKPPKRGRPIQEQAQAKPLPTRVGLLKRGPETRSDLILPAPHFQRHRFLRCRGRPRRRSSRPIRRPVCSPCKQGCRTRGGGRDDRQNSAAMPMSANRSSVRRIYHGSAVVSGTKASLRLIQAIR